MSINIVLIKKNKLLNLYMSINIYSYKLKYKIVFCVVIRGKKWTKIIPKKIKIQIINLYKLKLKYKNYTKKKNYKTL
jgi:hypothetical protein